MEREKSIMGHTEYHMYLLINEISPQSSKSRDREIWQAERNILYKLGVSGFAFPLQALEDQHLC